MPTLAGSLVAEASAWRIPAYARDMLWIAAGGEAAPVTGPHGSYRVERGAADAPLLLTWGTADGPPLAVWPPSDTSPAPPDWDGTVRLAGFVERLHVLEAHGLELVVAEVQGALLPAGYPRLPTLDEMRAAPFARDPAQDHPAAREATYPLLAPAGSIQAEYLHHALISELSVDCFAALGPHEGGWHTIVGLPLLVEALSLLAPAYRGRLG